MPINKLRSLFLDCGHSVRYPGARGFRDEVMWVRTICGVLKPLINGYKWVILPVPDSYGPLDLTANGNLLSRIKFINSHCMDGDFVLSLHANASLDKNVRGVTTCYMGGSNYMKEKAKQLSKSYAQQTGVPVLSDGSFDDRNSRFGQLGMCRNTRPAALLIECGFVTNVKDMAINIKSAAQGIADFINKQ